MFQSIELLGKTINLGDLFNNLAVVAQLLFTALTIKDYKTACTFPILANRYLNKKHKNSSFVKSLFMYLEVVVIVLVITIAMKSLTPVISKIFLGDESVNYFPNILLAPFFFPIVCILLKASPLKVMDIAAPVLAISLCFYKIACYCDGCCYGIEYGTHFFNAKNNRYEIPIQLIELACAVIMVAILLIMRKNKKRPGFMYPTFMLMYSGSRFFSEFLRDDYPPVIGRLSGYHIQCIIGFVLGAICLFVVVKYGTKITEFLETRNKAYLDKKLAEYDEKHTIVHHDKKKKR